jgi:hypothetical protein
MNLKNLCLLLSILFLAIGVGATFMEHNPGSMVGVYQGLFKGLGGVFFIVFYILMLLGKQPMDKTGAEHY